jgi:hypothetical protein
LTTVTLSRSAADAAGQADAVDHHENVIDVICGRLCGVGRPGSRHSGAADPCLLQQLKMLTSSSSIKDADCDLVVGLCAASVMAW